MIDNSTKYLANLLLFAVLFCGSALAQCPDGLCPVRRLPQSPIPNPGSTELAEVQSPLLHAAHCRIFVGDGSTGSGTLVDRNERAGLVLTCSHLFDGTSEGVIVAFPNGLRFAARLIDRDRAHDLAALVIQRPEIEPISVGETEPSGVLTACGYGSDGRFRPLTGQVTGRAIPAGAAYPSVKLSGSVRPGDSGGGVLDARGRLVGVVWGQRNGETYFSCCQPLRQFLDRILHRGQSPPAGREVVDIPTTGPQTPAPASPKWQEEMESSITGRFSVLDNRLEAIGRQLDRLGRDKVGFIQGLSFGKLIAGTLGLSGPLAAAVVVAGGLIGRRVKSRVESQEPEATPRPTLGPSPSIHRRRHSAPCPRHTLCLTNVTRLPGPINGLPSRSCASIRAPWKSLRRSIL